MEARENRPLLYGEEDSPYGEAVVVKTSESIRKNSMEDATSYTDFFSLKSETSEKEASPTRNRLNAVNGVYIPCLLNIIGVILFLRLGWAIGQAGLSGVLLIFAIAELQAVLTVTSASAIASNGSMRGGGPYYLISRSLGPELGGAIGIQYYFLYAVGVAFYMVGIATSLQETFFPHPAIHKRLVVILIGSIALIFIVIIGIIGAKAFAKVNIYLFVAQFATVIVGLFCIWFHPSGTLSSGYIITAPSIETLNNNFKSNFTSELGICGPGTKCSIAKVFAIVFPLATGFMEGINLSGDLKNPGKSIPRGTFSAVATAFLTYLIVILTFASSFPGYTLRNDLKFFQESCFSEYVIVIGIALTCFSSGLGSLFGASRMLQAMSRDNLFPLFSPFGQGSLHGDEPQYAVVFTWVVAQCCIFIGDLDVIAPICTSFYCLVYSFVNFTCFILIVTGVPNFRPTFRYASWPLSLAGTLLNVGVMFYLNTVYAAVSLLILSLIFVSLYITAPATQWGDISQALIYHQVRKYLLRLDVRKAHMKFWRPSILLMVKDLHTPLADLCNDLKKGGLYVVGDVIIGDFNETTAIKCEEKRELWLNHISQSKIKAIPQILTAANPRVGYQMLMQCSGLGGMQINTVALPWLEELQDSSENKFNNIAITQVTNYVALIKDALVLKKNVVLFRHVESLDLELVIRTEIRHGDGSHRAPLLGKKNQPSRQTIDVWITHDWTPEGLDSHVYLSLQLAQIMHSNKSWGSKTDLRIFKLTEPMDEVQRKREHQKLLNHIINARIRVKPEHIILVDFDKEKEFGDTPVTELEQATAINKILQERSLRTCQLYMTLPEPPKNLQNSENYWMQVKMLTNNLPATILTLSAYNESVITTCI